MKVEIYLIFLTILSKRVHAGGSALSYLSFCHKFFDIFDAQSVYQGSSCFMDLQVSWMDARTICEANNMFLLKILNTAVQNSLFASSASLYGSNPLKSIWINTQKDASGNWISYQGNFTYRMLTPARLPWVNVAAQSLGPCMTITNQIGPFRVSSADCGQKFSFICSFNRTIF